MSFSPEKVVVPVDFSEEMEHALKAALDITDDPSQVYAIHVLFPLEVMSPGVVWGEVDDQKREESVRESFERFAKEKGFAGIRFSVRVGDPGLDITDYAKEIGADLIVVPSHGYHGLKRLVLGSVAERVIRHANCSVLVLRRGDAD